MPLRPAPRARRETPGSPPARAGGRQPAVDDGGARPPRPRDGPDRVVVDVTYRELLEAPVETVLGLYERFSLPIPDGLEPRLRAEAAEHARGRQPRQDYNLAEFGLTADAVRDRVR